MELCGDVVVMCGDVSFGCSVVWRRALCCGVRCTCGVVVWGSIVL